MYQIIIFHISHLNLDWFFCCLFLSFDERFDFATYIFSDPFTFFFLSSRPTTLHPAPKRIKEKQMCSRFCWVGSHVTKTNHFRDKLELLFMCHCAMLCENGLYILRNVTCEWIVDVIVDSPRQFQNHCVVSRSTMWEIRFHHFTSPHIEYLPNPHCAYARLLYPEEPNSLTNVASLRWLHGWDCNEEFN